MSDFINWNAWIRFRDQRNADKARGGFVRWVKGPHAPKDRTLLRNRLGSTFGNRHPAGDKLARKAQEGRVGACTVGVVSKAYIQMQKNQRAA